MSQSRWFQGLGTVVSRGGGGKTWGFPSSRGSRSWDRTPPTDPAECSACGTGCAGPVAGSSARPQHCLPAASRKKPSVAPQPLGGVHRPPALRSPLPPGPSQNSYTGEQNCYRQQHTRVCGKAHLVLVAHPRRDVQPPQPTRAEQCHPSRTQHRAAQRQHRPRQPQQHPLAGAVSSLSRSRLAVLGQHGQGQLWPLVCVAKDRQLQAPGRGGCSCSQPHVPFSMALGNAAAASAPQSASYG